MAKRYVELEKFINSVEATPRCTLATALAIANNYSTADVAEVKHGEWIEDFKPIDTVGMGSGKRSYLVGYKCSLCGRSEIKKEPYCNCGACMDGGKAE